MKLRINASAVKSWFQYRCERKLVYDAAPLDLKNAIPIERVLIKSAWSDFGMEFERRVILELAARKRDEVLMPARGEDVLTPAATLAFLRRRHRTPFAHQAVLRETPTLRRLLELPDEVHIGEGRPDLIEVIDGEVPEFRIIDVKATQVATLFHKTQVALYALMLRATLTEAGIPGIIHAEAAIWHVPLRSNSELVWEAEAFRLQGYEQSVMDFFQRDVPRARSREIGRSRDDTAFHVYFKCEQCTYVAHCEKAFGGKSAETWDVSAVPGLTQESKRVLASMGVHTVGDLVHTSTQWRGLQSTNWAIRTRGDLLAARAQALLDGAVRRMPDRYTWLMPPRIDVAIYLVADRDPGDGVLVALGCLVERAGREDVLIKVSGARGERDALAEVLGLVTRALSEVDARNAAGEALIAHIFLYEPAEARDLQEGLGRHLGDTLIRGQLLDLIRIFPPDEVVVHEPDYKGVHHLPASAVRSILEDLYALPVKVGYDLASVSTALAAATPPLGSPYRPTEGFARRFSSRLSVDQTQRILHGSPVHAEIERDIAARLRGLASMVHWLIDDNARAEVPFLRLRKAPFRLQARFNPLQATALDVLLAQELLENRTARLTALIALARPADARRDRFRCFAELRLDSITNGPYNGKRMKFLIPEASRQCELSAGTLGLILTNDDPDLRLDPDRWSEVRVSIVNDDPRSDRLVLDVPKKVYTGPTFSRLRSTTPDDGWYLDEVHIDVTTDRAVRFLESLIEVSNA